MIKADVAVRQEILDISKGRSNFDMIKAYILADGKNVTLTDEQQMEMQILEHTDQLIRQSQGKKKRSDIAREIGQKYGFDVHKGYRFIAAAEDLFSSFNPLNKKYKIQARIEFLESIISKLEEKHSYKEIAALESILQKYIDSYPEAKVTRTRRVQNFILPTGVQPQSLNTAAAMRVLSDEITEESGSQSDQSSNDGE